MARPVATGAVLAVAVVAFLCDGAAAQTQPPPKTVDTANLTILPADKQQKIKDFVRRQDGLKEAEPIQRSEESFTAGMTTRRRSGSPPCRRTPSRRCRR